MSAKDDSPSDIQTRGRDLIDAISVPSGSTVREAMRAIDRGAVGLALVVDSGTGTFKALVTDGDLRRSLLDGAGLESVIDKFPRPTPTVGQVGMQLSDLRALFDDRVRAIPLLDDEHRAQELVLFDARVRLPVSQPKVGERELRYVQDCILSGWISSSGDYVRRLESAFADLCGTRHAVATSNGTAALHLSLLALDIGPGDEVIVPALTFIATANVVTYTGATPVMVDVDPDTWNIDPAQIETAITPLTKAIMPVHLYGIPADMDAILEISRRHAVPIVEDAAQAHGAEYHGARVGGLGDLGCFSFFGNKIITTGEGGMIVTNRSDLAERAAMLRGHGMSKERRYWHEVLGFNYRMTNLQAAVGVAQMERVEEILAKKRRIASWYRKRLSGIPGLRLPLEPPGCSGVYWLFSILVDPEIFPVTSDEVARRLSEQGIDVRPLFPPVHTQPIYATGQNLPVSERLAEQGISLPSYEELTESDVKLICNRIRELSS